MTGIFVNEMAADSSPANHRYNDEVMLLDSLHEFHPEFFAELSEDELAATRTYYLTGQEVPDNIFEYRRELLRRDSEIESQAQAAFAKLCAHAGIENDDA